MLVFNCHLLGFRAPPQSRIENACSQRTVELIRQITVLADATADIEIACKPNIWSQNHNEAVNRRSHTESSPESTLSLSSQVSTGATSMNVELANLCSSVRDYPYLQLWHPESFETENRYFVIKSFSILDVQASVAHGIWSSTNLGNKRLDKAFQNTQGRVYLFFSVNGSGSFCGVCRMMGTVDFESSSDIWAEASRWKGVFPVEWLCTTEVINSHFRHLRIATNNNRPVFYSRDTQELSEEIGTAMLKIYASHSQTQSGSAKFG